MKRAALIAVVLAAVAASDRWAASPLPPTVFAGRAEAAEPAAKPASEKLKVLEAILASRNDNDPRLDLDFNGMSAEDKRLFRNKYRELAVEKRNERGTVVYLLGKNLKTREDWEFFRQVALEPPCLSLSDCSKKPAPGSDEEATGDEVTLAYPSLVALRQAKRIVEESRTRVSTKGAKPPAAEKEALALFSAAKKSRTPAVARTAASLEKKFAPARRP
jgi:hypothetical protein